MRPSLVKRSSRPALATWLFLSVMFATVSAVLICTTIVDRVIRDEDQRQATEFLQTHANALRDALDRGMRQHHDEVRVIGQLDQIARSNDPKAMRRALEQVHDSFPQFAWLGVTDRKGIVIASADGLLQGADVSARPWFAGALNGPFVGDVHPAVLLAKLLPAQTEPWRFVDIAVPVKGADGSVQGVFGIHLSWEWAVQMKRELVDQPLEQHEAQAMILSGNGTVLLGPPELQGKLFNFALEDGYFTVQSKTRGSGAYAGLGWNVVLRQPEDVAMRSYREVGRRAWMAAALVCLLLTPLLWWLARKLASPLLALSARLESEDVKASAPLGNLLYREADLLAQALRRFAERHVDDVERLRELNVTLEERVANRTSDLARSNEDLSRANRDRQHSEQLLRDITNNVPALIAYFDADERCRFANTRALQVHGIDAAQLGNLTLRDALGPRYEQHRPYIQQALSGRAASYEAQAEVGKRMVDFHTHFVPDIAPDGRVLGCYILSHDQTSLKDAQRTQAALARTDALTGLPNRQGLNERLSEALARSRRSKQPLGLLFLDIDKFKSINDTLGHACGDEVLKIFAERLRACVRETDVVGRLGGDEFVIVLENLHTTDEAQFVARKLLAVINRPFELPHICLDVSTSIGIAFNENSRIDPCQLMDAADQALYEAKAAGRNTYRTASL